MDTRNNIILMISRTTSNQPADLSALTGRKENMKMTKKCRKIGSVESEKDGRYYVVLRSARGMETISAKSWDWYVARCRNAGETPVNPEERGITITAD